MPYYHVRCGGQIRWYGILPIPPKCKKCGKVWNPLVIYGPPRKDMEFRLPEVKIKREETSYASWADKVPGVGTVASILPNWPRWARVVTVVLILLIIFGGSYLIWRS